MCVGLPKWLITPLAQEKLPKTVQHRHYQLYALNYRRAEFKMFS